MANKYFAIIFTAALLTAGHIYAEKNVHEVVVTASRREVLLSDTPDIVQVISRKQIDEIKPSSTGELLQYSTGAARSTGTGSGLPDRSVISINGLPPKYTLVLLNGVPLLTDHIHTGQNIDLISPDTIERIEIMRGASSAQYGADAIGGIVNIITKDGTETPTGRAGVAVGDYDTIESSLSLLFPAGDKVRMSSFLNWEETDGVPLKAPAHRVGKTGYERLSFLGRMDADLSSDTDLFIWLNLIETTMDWREGTADSTMATPTAGISHKLSPSLRAFGQMAYSEWDAEVNNELNRLIRTEGNLTLDASESHRLMTGIEHNYNEFERTAVTAPSQTSFGLFLQDEWIANEQVAIMSALRYDKTEDLDGAISPKVSLMFAPSDRVRARASIGRGFHAPTLQELYEEGYGHGGSAYRFGNPDLEPEYSTTVTAGVEGKPTEFMMVMLYTYYSDLDDMIVPVYEGPWTKDPSIDVWRRTNINNAEVYGAEVSALINLSDSLSIDGGYTITENEDKDTGRNLPYSPGSTMYAKVNHTCSLAGSLELTTFIGVHAGFDREAWNWKPEKGTLPDNPNGLTTELDDYTRLDVGLTVTLNDRLDISAKIENILGEDIENLDDSYTIIDGEPYVKVGLNYEFALATAE